MLVISPRGPPLVVKSVAIENHPEGVPVYNFTIEDDHTYFVGKVNGGIWVHNNDCELDILVADILKEKRRYQECEA